MSKEGPTDPRFQIPGGTLLYHPERDERFPYLYEIPSHILVHSPEYIKKILIRVMDTSIDARKALATFEKTLSVPLGPDADMTNYGPSISLIDNLFKQPSQFCWRNAGLFELEPGTILFARPLTKDGIYLEENDVVESWCLEG